MTVVLLYLFHVLVQVCEIELKGNGNPDLVCEKEFSHMCKTVETQIWCARKPSKQLALDFNFENMNEANLDGELKQCCSISVFCKRQII